MMKVKLEATYLRNNEYAVRPEGRIGTCGFYPAPWTVSYIRARNPVEAVQKAINLQPPIKGITLVGQFDD